MTITITPMKIGVLLAIASIIIGLAAGDPTMMLWAALALVGAASYTWLESLQARADKLEDALRYLAKLPENPDFHDGYAMSDLRKHIAGLAEHLPPEPEFPPSGRLGPDD